jgi:hypothetical protein
MTLYIVKNIWSQKPENKIPTKTDLPAKSTKLMGALRHLTGHEPLRRGHPLSIARMVIQQTFTQRGGVASFRFWFVRRDIAAET